MNDEITFTDLKFANGRRQQEWDPDDQITPAFRGTELGGEVGEALNCIKKLERERMGIRGSRTTREHLAEELADIVICTDLIASMYQINLAEAIKNKFNKTSDANGLETHL